MGISPIVKADIKKMILAGDTWADIRKASGASYETIAKIKKRMLASDTEVATPKKQQKAEPKSITPEKPSREIIENATVEQLKQEAVGTLLHRVRNGKLDDTGLIRILAATTEKKELGNLAQNLTINILQVVSNARQSAIEKVERAKKGTIEKIIDATAIEIEAPAFESAEPEAPQQPAPESPQKP